MDGTQGAGPDQRGGVMEEAKKELIEPELIKFEEKLADITFQGGSGAVELDLAPG
jgi:hypothetical protein